MLKNVIASPPTTPIRAPFSPLATERARTVVRRRARRAALSGAPWYHCTGSRRRSRTRRAIDIDIFSDTKLISCTSPDCTGSGTDQKPTRKREAATVREISPIVKPPCKSRTKSTPSAPQSASASSVSALFWGMPGTTNNRAPSAVHSAARAASHRLQTSCLSGKYRGSEARISPTVSGWVMGASG